MFQGVYDLGGKCPRGKCLGVSVWGVYLLGISVQGVHVQGVYVLEPSNFGSQNEILLLIEYKISYV